MKHKKKNTQFIFMLNHKFVKIRYIVLYIEIKKNNLLFRVIYRQNSIFYMLERRPKAS